MFLYSYKGVTMEKLSHRLKNDIIQMTLDKLSEYEYSGYIKKASYIDKCNFSIPSSECYTVNTIKKVCFNKLASMQKLADEFIPANSLSLRRLELAERLMAEAQSRGLSGQEASDYIINAMNNNNGQPIPQAQPIPQESPVTQPVGRPQVDLTGENYLRGDMTRSVTQLKSMMQQGRISPEEYAQDLRALESDMISRGASQDMVQSVFRDTGVTSGNANPVVTGGQPVNNNVGNAGGVNNTNVNTNTNTNVNSGGVNNMNSGSNNGGVNNIGTGTNMNTGAGNTYNNAGPSKPGLVNNIGSGTNVNTSAGSTYNNAGPSKPGLVNNIGSGTNINTNAGSTYNNATGFNGGNNVNNINANANNNINVQNAARDYNAEQVNKLKINNGTNRRGGSVNSMAANTNNVNGMRGITYSGNTSNIKTPGSTVNNMVKPNTWSNALKGVRRWARKNPGWTAAGGLAAGLGASYLGRKLFGNDDRPGMRISFG